jgi:hypothetical protein
MVKKGTAEFFGVNDDNNSQNQKWQQRRMRLLSNYGKLKTKVRTNLKLLIEFMIIINFEVFIYNN